MTSGIEIDLRSRHRVGRAEGADLRLVDPRVSGDHALLRWELGSWLVQDLSSTNGVYIGGERIAPGEGVPLSVGSVLGFGAPEGSWRLVDAGPPLASATSGATRREAVAGRIALPSEEAIRCLVTLDPNRGWLLRDPAGERLVTDGEVIFDGQRRWALRLPAVLPRTARTARSTTLSRCKLVCTVSQDEETVEMRLRVDGEERKVGDQVWGYFVLQVVRARIRDAGLGVASGEQGWVSRSQLEADLKTKENQLNVWIHRFKRRMLELGVEDGESVIESRDRGRVIRLGLEAEATGGAGGGST